MTNSIHLRIKTLLEETSDAYDIAGANGNGDYADFASMSLPEFKQVLNRSNLTGQELQRILRHGFASHRREAPKDCWATFMARYVETNANLNSV